MNIHQIYRPFLIYFRTKRMRQFWSTFQLTSETKVIDVGGGPFNWSLLPEQPHLVFLKIYYMGDRRDWIIADGCQLPIRDHAFDVVYSNSVIEHLANLDRQSSFAAECRRVGLRYYVQTPNRYFPVEPHLITPFIHWLPRWVQRQLLRNFTVWGLVTRPTQNQCDEFMKEIRLLDEGELQSLFPDCEIWHERVLGLTKSLIAVKI